MDDWRTLKSETVFQHPIIKVNRVLREKPSGQPYEFVVFNSPDWVNVVPITPQKEVVLIRQWRHGSQETTLEIPGGIIDPGETPQEAGARELREETGYRSARLTQLGCVRPNPALFDNRCFTFLAVDAEPAGKPCLDESELIEVLTRPLADIPDMVKKGEINHSLVVAAFTFFWLGQKKAGLAL